MPEGIPEKQNRTCSSIDAIFDETEYLPISPGSLNFIALV